MAEPEDDVDGGGEPSTDISELPLEPGRWAVEEFDPDNPEGVWPEDHHHQSDDDPPDIED